MRLLNMQPGSLYNLLHPIVYSYEQAVAKGQGRQWIADCFEIKQQQSRPSLMLPRCGVVSTTFFLSLLGMHKKLNTHSLYAGRDLAISQFKMKASKKRKNNMAKKLYSQLTPLQRRLRNSDGLVEKNPTLLKTGMKTRTDSQKRAKRRCTTKNGKKEKDVTHETDEQRYGRMRLQDTVVWILDYGMAMNNIAKENRAYIIYKGLVKRSGRSLHPDLQVAWNGTASQDQRYSLSIAEKKTVENITIYQGSVSGR